MHPPGRASGLYQVTNSFITPSLHLCSALKFCLFVVNALGEEKTFSHRIAYMKYIVVLREQRCRDGVMNEFVSWYRHLLVSFLFHAVTSLHPPSLHRNDFSSWGKVPTKVLFVPQARRFYAHACAQSTRVMHVNGVVQCQPWKSATIYHRNVRREKNDRSVSMHTTVDCRDVW